MAYMSKIKTLRHVLADNVKARRGTLKLSQSKVASAAKRAGGQIDQRTIGRIENADVPVGVDALESLAKGLASPAWQLLIPDGQDEKFLAILSAWEQADDSGRRLLFIAATGALESNEPGRPRPERKPQGAER